MAAKYFIWILLFTLSATAQQKFLSVSPNPVPDSCWQMLEIAKNALAEVGAPEQSWNWVVFCRDQDWSLTMRSAGVEHNTDCAVTVLSKGFTYIKGSCLSDPSPLVTPAYLIAHERGHIATGSKREEDADKWAKQHGFQWGKH